MRPVNDICVDCAKNIEPTAERNYIVWEKTEYRRQCAKCHDKHATPVSHTHGHSEMPITSGSLRVQILRYQVQKISCWMLRRLPSLGDVQ